MTRTLTLTLLFLAVALAGAAPPVGAVSTAVVVKEVYGGGGNTGAAYANDFVELFNKSSSPVSISGWSIQYASASGATWQVTALPDVTLSPGQHFLIQQASGGPNGAPLPAPDATGTFGMAAGAGKVVVASVTTPLTGGCPSDVSVVDLVGYGTATCFEGAGAAPAPSNTLSDQRLGSGCQETDDNAADFAAEAPTPQNTASAASTCTPSAARLVSFTATRSARGVVLRWRTAAEVGTIGFNVYARASADKARLNRALISARGAATGGTYAWRAPAGAASKEVRYELEEVRADGTRARVAEARIS